jgi:hypothetical protein
MSSFKAPFLPRSGPEPSFRESAFDDFLRFSLASAYDQEEPGEVVWARIESQLCTDRSPSGHPFRDRFGADLARFTSQLIHVLFYDPSFYERLDERKLYLASNMLAWPGSGAMGLTVA